MSELTRREFIKTSVVGAGAMIASPSLAAETVISSAKFQACDRVELGKTGIVASRLAMGTGMHGSQRSSDHTKLGQKKFTELIRHGYDNGLNFIDMADLYGSHPFVKNAMQGIQRDKYVLLSKLWFREGRVIKPSGGAIKEVDQYRKELGTDMIDVVLIHCANKPTWAEDLKRVRDEMSELKQKGAIRACGVSCHSHQAMKVAAELEWTDVILARINNKGAKMGGSPEEISKTIAQARANGKCVLGMKIFGEGTLTQPEQKDASLKYVLKNDIIDAMTIGMLSTEQIDDSMKRIAGVA
jgi:1-deoxyxylulose-5-phosphate synthase